VKSEENVKCNVNIKYNMRICDIYQVTRDISTCDIPRLSGSIVGN